jgi:hypothetical protein
LGRSATAQATDLTSPPGATCRATPDRAFDFEDRTEGWGEIGIHVFVAEGRRDAGNVVFVDEITVRAAGTAGCR